MTGSLVLGTVLRKTDLIPLREGRVLSRAFNIFLSSTSADLVEERTVFIDLVHKLGHFLVGMEFFTGGLTRTTEVIEQRLEQADGMILLVKGRYGSLEPARNQSYTHLEFSWARENNLPVIAFVLREDQLPELPAKYVEQDDEGRARLGSFRQELGGQYVNQWADLDDLARLAGPALGQWIRETLEADPDRGWIRAVDQANQKVPSEDVRLQRDVYRYVFNALTPGRDVRVETQFLEKLATNLKNVSHLREASERLIKDYAVPLLPRGMRVYLAHELSEERARKTPGGNYRYQLGVSNSAEDEWVRGRLVGRFSNIHEVFTSRSSRIVANVEEDPDRINARVEGEASVVNVPVMFLDDVVAVLGLSSPEPFGVVEFERLADELALILSALVFAFGEFLKRDHPDATSSDIARLIRGEISSVYSALPVEGEVPLAGGIPVDPGAA